jgi:fatty acid desaturase
MSGLLLRREFIRRFSGLRRYSRLDAWLVMGGYVSVILASVWLGHVLLSMPATVWSVALMVMTSVFIGTRIRGINNIVHECSHASFSEHWLDNARIGRVCTALLMKSFRDYRDDHLSHHANNGDYESDAEFAVIRKFGLHDPLTVRTVLRHIVTPLTGRHLPVYVSIRVSRADGDLFLWVKLALLSPLALFTLLAPLTALFFVIVPLFYIYPTLNYWTDCLDHAGLVGAKDELEASRNVLAPAPIRWLFFPRNDCYHLVHHLFPQVPARHLDVAHAELSKDPAYNSQPAAVRPTRLGLGMLLAQAARGKGRKDIRSPEA